MPLCKERLECSKFKIENAGCHSPKGYFCFVPIESKKDDGSKVPCSVGLSCPDYEEAYTYASNLTKYDTKLWEMQNGAAPLDWDTIRDRLADAYMAGVEAAR